jgi:hypothetical protein
MGDGSPEDKTRCIMKCEKCKAEMDAVGFGTCNGWECPFCFHRVPDTYTLAGQGFECPCTACQIEREMRSRIPKSIKVEVAQVHMRKRVEAKGNREILDKMNRGLNS